MSDFAKTALLALVLAAIGAVGFVWTDGRQRECAAAGGVLVRGVAFSLECVEPAR